MKFYRASDLTRTGLLGLVLGGSAGFLAGLLVAPDRGERLRRRIAFRVDQAAEEVGRAVDRAFTGPPTRDARARGEALVSDAEAEAARIRGDIDRLLREQRSRARG